MSQRMTVEEARRAGLLPAGEAKRQNVRAVANPPAKPRGMNKLEQRMHERLSAMLASGAIAWFT